MSENQYNAPAMEVVEFDKEDVICTSDPSKPGVDFGPGPDGGGF